MNDTITVFASNNSKNRLDRVFSEGFAIELEHEVFGKLMITIDPHKGYYIQANTSIRSSLVIYPGSNNSIYVKGE
jgi:hypothetical protein